MKVRFLSKVVAGVALMAVVPLSAQSFANPDVGQRRQQVGENIAADFASPHPYPVAFGAQPTLVWSQEIFHPSATYVTPHFSRFELAPGDFVIVRSPDSRRSWRYEGLGKANFGREGGEGFWGIHISGDRAIVELYSAGGKNAYGFHIDSYARGFTAEEMGIAERSICTSDDKENAICYETDEPALYDKSRAVVRLFINGSFLCTGWLVGDEGHMMTNEHCISSDSAAMNTTYEFMAEGATCDENCPQLGCDGVVEETTGTLVQDSVPLDYALIALPGNHSGTYGFMQLRGTGAVLEERIYSPQHPAGRAKEIAVVSTYPENPSGFAEVDSITEPPCDGSSVAPEVGYWLDTEGGSSGSPVLGYDDNLVVALHHCRGSGFCSTGNPAVDDPNRGVSVLDIITDLGANLPNNAIGGGSDIFADNFESGDTTGWPASQP